MAIRSSNEGLASGLDVLNAFAQLKRASTGPSAPDEAKHRSTAVMGMANIRGPCFTGSGERHPAGFTVEPQCRRR